MQKCRRFIRLKSNKYFPIPCKKCQEFKLKYDSRTQSFVCEACGKIVKAKEPKMENNIRY